MFINLSRGSFKRRGLILSGLLMLSMWGALVTTGQPLPGVEVVQAKKDDKKPPKPPKPPKPGKPGPGAGGTCTTFEFSYTDGHSDIGEFCGRGVDITAGSTGLTTQSGTLHVPKLHISCSDPFPGGFSNGKSDLGGHQIATWTIVKSDGKTCGDTPTTVDCATWFFGSAPVGTRFSEGDTWQGGTFTFIEDDNQMLVRQEDTGDVVGRFPMGFLNGDMATIDFASAITITKILWHDNDPNPGEAGWSLNGIVGPITGDGNTIITTVNLTTSQVMIDAGGDSGGIDICFSGGGGNGGGGEGCTPGYWKVPQHHDSWVATGYTTGQTVESVFDVPDSLGMDNRTLLQALDGGGGPGVTGAATILLRAATASLLNAAHPDVSFGQTTSQVISSVNAALATLNRGTMLALAGDLDDANNQGCPLN